MEVWLDQAQVTVLLPDAAALANQFRKGGRVSSGQARTQVVSRKQLLAAHSLCNRCQSTLHTK